MTTERTVKQVIEIAKQWIVDKYSLQPGFVGAHLVGSLHHMPLDAVFPAYRDVDLAIIFDNIEEQSIDNTDHQGLLVEAIVVPAHRYVSAEKLLADPSNASIFAAEHSILLDPKGNLIKLTKTFAKEYPKLKWVSARCNKELTDANIALEQLTQAQDVSQAVFAIGELSMRLSAMLTIVLLTPLTHRRNLLQLRDIISTDKEKQIFEKLHQLIGSQNITSEQANNLLSKTVEAFDYSLTVHKKPVPYNHKLVACDRPYLLKGTTEMFDEDGYRESIAWITLFMMISCAAIKNDAPPEQQAKYLPYAQELLKTLGLVSPEDISKRIQIGQNLVDEMIQLCNHTMDTSADIIR